MPGSTEGFGEYYRTLADEELLSLALQREGLVAAAGIALDAEMASRGLDETVLREFEQRLQESGDEESEGPEDPAPPATELPSDWFDDDTAVVNDGQTLATSRPKGITVLAYGFWLTGVIALAVGIWLSYATPAGTPTFTVAIGILGLFLGALQLITGRGLWRMKRWARATAETICWFNVIVSAVGIGILAYSHLRGVTVDPAMSVSQFIGFGWNVLWALYLGRDTTRSAFRVAMHV